MKIIASIPTRMVAGPGWRSFPEDLIEVEVVRILRYRCDRTRPRYSYQADVKIPLLMHPEAPNVVGDGLYRVNVFRKLNPGWKPPVFSDRDVVDLREHHGRPA